MKPARWSDESWCRVHRGLAELAAGERIAAAREDFDAVLAIDPHNSDALRSLKGLDRVGDALFRAGLSKLNGGQTADAQKQFDQAIAAKPELKDKVADELRNAVGASVVGQRPTTIR